MGIDVEGKINQAQTDIAAVSSAQELETFRIKYLGSKGILKGLFAELAGLPPAEKPKAGQAINSARNRITQLFEDKKKEIAAAGRDKAPALDLTLPGVRPAVGHKHLLTQTMEEICAIFEGLGFVVQEGPEIETEFNNFTALNIPPDHPARDGFDTFYLDKKNPDEPANFLLRSHTSPGQSRIMKAHKPPLAVIIPGRVYRPDAVDASHSFMFHQIEGLLVDKHVRFADLKGLLTVFCKKLFGNDIQMRFRPHFFPFTEPSAEVDISWKGGKKKWLEIMGCGMVHPQVFKAVGYPAGKYTGLAFGLGVERIAMLKYGIGDIRTFFENDQRFLEQF